MLSINNKITANVTPLYNWSIWIGVIVFTFFSAVRWDVGIDHLSYLEDYSSICKYGSLDREDMEIGYVYLQLFLAELGAHFTIYFGLVAFMQLFFCVNSFRKELYILPYLLVLIMCGGDYFFWMNGMRQALVCTAFLFVVSLTIERRRVLLYICMILLLSFIHTSAVFLLPFCLLYFFNLEKFFIPRWLQLSLFFAALFLSQMSIWEYLLKYVDIISAAIGYDRFDANTLNSLEGREMNFGVRRILMLIVDICLIFSSKKLHSVFPSKKFGFVYIMYVIFFVIEPLFMSSLVLSRVTAYFHIFRVIVGSFFLFYLFKIHKTKNGDLVGAVFVLLFVMHLLVQIYADAGNHTDCIRYQFCFGKNLPILI